MTPLKNTYSIAALCLGVFLHAPATTAANNTSAVAQWEFGTEEATPLKAKGNVHRDQAGPRPPEFPDMAANNTAVRVDASAYLSVPDTGSNSDFDFTNGDAITIEAWVNPSALREGQVSYVVGKGRTGSPKFARDNQNWSLRVVGAKNEAKLSFLFATKLSSSDSTGIAGIRSLAFPSGQGGITSPSRIASVIRNRSGVGSMASRRKGPGVTAARQKSRRSSMTMRFVSATVSQGCSTRLRFTAPCWTTKLWRHVSIASASRALSGLSRKSCLNWPMFLKGRVLVQLSAGLARARSLAERR